ncbi:HU family DNA-binding protein, partial [Prevotella sp.]|uniref:HU family DNA-binding protein n=1 Tax=Prevotella sp. TaxID=59823 RepID=UPI003AF440E6
MLKYTITKSDANNGTKDKWYGRIVYDETIDMDGLAEHMRQHNIPYTKGQLKGVMADLVRCIYELTTAGKKVKLPDLGIFRIKARGKGAKTKDDCTITECLLGNNLQLPSFGRYENEDVGRRTQQVGREVEASGASVIIF